MSERRLNEIAQRMAELVQQSLDTFPPMERKRRKRKFLDTRRRSKRAQRVR